MSEIRRDVVVRKEYNKIYGHNCKLVIAEDPVSVHVNDGWFLLLRRSIKRLLIVDEKLERSRMLYRSSCKMTMAKQRQLRHAHYSIHPYSKFRFHWEKFMFFVILITIIYMPMQALKMLPLTQTVLTGVFILDMCCLSHIVVECFSGYYDKNSDNVVMNTTQILRHYATGLLIFDLMAVFPVTVLYTMIQEGNIPIILVVSHFCRLFRLPSCTRYMQNWTETFNLKYYKFHLIEKAIQYCVFILYTTYVIFYFTKFGHDHFLINHDSYMVLRGMWYTMKTLFLLKPYYYSDTGQAYIQFLLMNLGNLLDGLLYALFWQIYNRASNVKSKHEHVIEQIREYAKFKELPDSVNKVLMQYIDFKFGGRIYNEQLILNTLTPHLRDELFYLYSQDLVESVQLFADMPNSAIKRIAARLKSEIFLPNDVIMQAGYEGTNMYFIIAGIVAVYTSTGKEICHLTDGANFGEIALLTNETRTASVVAADFCELFRLNRKDFQEAIEPFPELKSKVIQIAQERYTNLLSIPVVDE